MAEAPLPFVADWEGTLAVAEESIEHTDCSADSIIPTLPYLDLLEVAVAAALAAHRKDLQMDPNCLVAVAVAAAESAARILQERQAGVLQTDCHTYQE